MDNKLEIIAISHGSFAKEIIKSAEMIVGPMNNISSYCLYSAQEPLDFLASIKNEIKDNRNYLIIADLFGGTPCNMVTCLLQNNNIEVVTGLNLAMLIEVYSKKDLMTLQELKELALDTLQHSGYDVRKELLKIKGEN